MKRGTKFAIGAVLIVASVGYLMASGVKQTGQYFLTPTELNAEDRRRSFLLRCRHESGARVCRVP